MIFVLEIIICICILLREKRVSLSVINILYWCFFCLIGGIYYRKIFYSNMGSCYIVFLCILFYLASNFSQKIKIKRKKQDKKNTLNNYVALFWGAYIIEIVLVVYALVKGGYSLGTIKSFMLQSGMRYFVTSTSEVEMVSIFFTLLYAYLISIFAIDGYLIGKDIMCIGRKYRSSIVFLFIGTSLYAIFSSRKSILLWPIIFWISGIVSGIIEYTHLNHISISVIKFVRGNIKKISIISISVFSIFFLMLKYRSLAKGILFKGIDSFMAYGFGEIPVFNTWFSDIGTKGLNYSLGAQSVYGVLSQFGLDNELLYDNYALLGRGKVGNLSNVQTFYRGYLEDFGILGCCVMNFVIGFLSGLTEKRMLMGENEWYLTVNIFVIAEFVLFSFLISPWHYFTVFVASILVVIELFMIKKVKL